MEKNQEIRKDNLINLFDENGKPHGYWESYYSNGQLCYKGFYDMGNKVDYNPNEPKAIELTLDEIAEKLNIPVEQLKIKK